MSNLWLTTLFLTGLLTSTVTGDFDCEKGNKYTVRCGLRQGNRCVLTNWECDGTLECSDGGSDEFPCGYTAGYVYVYKYSGHLFFPHKDVNMHIKTTIKLMKINDHFIMKFENPVLSLSKEDPINLLSDEEIDSWKKEVKIKFKDNGEIANIYYDSSHPQDILNMKKGIISLFQVKLETNDDTLTHSYKHVETDVTGTCRVRYRTKRQVVPPLGNFQKLYKINVTRVNDYKDCENRPRVLYQNMDSVKCDEQPGYTIPTSRMRTSCVLYIREDKMSKQAVINSCESHERQEFNIKRTPGDSPLVMVTVRKYLTLEKMMVELHQTPKTWNTRSSLLFSFDGLYQKDNQNEVDQVKATLDRLNELVNEETKAWDLISAEAPSLFSKLIGQLKWKADDVAFREIYQLYFNQEKYRPWLESALPFVGSTAAGEEIKDKIETGSISRMSAVKLLTRLGMVNRPTKGLCENILYLCQTSVMPENATAHSTCWLAFGSLVHSYCKDKQTCPNKFIQAMKAEYDNNLHTLDHHMKVIKNNEKLVVALKTIGNSGQKRLLPQLMHIMTKWDDHNAIMIAAMEATRRMVLNDDAEQLKVQNALRDIFVKRSMCPEIRIVAFQELIKTGPTRADILMPLANTMRAEINPVMKQFVYTYLHSESKVNCPAKKSRKAAIDLLARTANLPRPSFEIRYSFSKSFNMGGITDIFTQGINLETVHTPISGIPRYIKLKQYMTMLGHYMEHVEHKARQREIIPLLRKLFGPYGMMEEKTSLWDFIRGKRSADDGFPEVYKRMKEMLDPSTRGELPFKATLSSKMFGSEIVYLVLNDSQTFIQNLMKDGTIRIDKDWWSNTLKAGFKFNISANDILFDAMRKIPTSMGIPLKLKTNTAGIFAYGLNVDAKTSPMLNLLSLSNKPTEISANCRECYSLSTYTKTKAYVLYRDLYLGYAVQQNMSQRCPVPTDKFTLNGKPPSQTYTIGSVMSKKKYTFYDSSSKFHRFVKLGGEYKKYDKVDWKTPHVSVMPGFGARTGQNSGGFQIPGLGQPPSGASGGWGPNARGAGQSSGGPPPGWVPGAGGASQSSGGPPPGWVPGAGGASQSSGGPPPGWVPGAGGASQSSGGPPPGWVPGAGGASQSSGGPPPGWGPVHMGGHVLPPPMRCIEAWNDSMKACMKKDNETGMQMWYEPNKRIIEEIQIKYQNITKGSDEEWKFLLEFHVNGENDTKIAEYHMEFNTTKPPQDRPPMWDFFSSGLDDNSGGFSAKAYEKRKGVITYMACLKSALDVPSKRWDLGVRWGKTCRHHSINMSTVLYYEDGHPNINMSIKWDGLPVMLERMTCPRKYFEEMQRQMREQMEKMKKQIGPNAGQGASGSRRQKRANTAGGSGGGKVGEGRRDGGSGGMVGRPPVPGQISNTSAIPGLESMPCFRSLDFKLFLKNSTTMELSGTLLPKPLNYSLPFNGTKAFEQTKDVVLYGITETCNVHSGNDITTFDKHTYTYDPSKGCPHVLAKDCSEKDLFTVFMKKDDSNRKTYTLVIKDKKNKGHVFVINPDMTLSHNGKPVQIDEGAEVNFPKVCKVSKSSSELVIRCKAGLILNARSGNLKIKITPWYFGYMCGMCGNFNWLSYDDFRAPQGFRREANNETFGTSWLIPGKTCNSGCKLVHRPDIQRPTGKVCVSRRPVTLCAPNCQPTRQASAKRTYHCLDSGTDEAKKVEQQITDKKFDEISKAFRSKDKNMKGKADVHVDCQCTCPAS